MPPGPLPPAARSTDNNYQDTRFTLRNQVSLIDLHKIVEV